MAATPHAQRSRAQVRVELRPQFDELPLVPLIDALETRQMPAWKAFKEKTHLAGQKVTAGKLIYTLRAQVSQEYEY